MPKHAKKIKVYDEVFKIRRSKRSGLRRSQRRTHKTNLKHVVDNRKAIYDRDHGGFKFGDDTWKRTNREMFQLRHEQQMVRKLRKKASKITNSGYARDDFIVADDAKIEDDAFEFDTDTILDRADAQAFDSGSDSDDSQNPPDFLCESSSDDSDLPEGEA